MSTTEEVALLASMMRRIAALEQALGAGDTTKVAKAGDTMTGQLEAADGIFVQGGTNVTLTDESGVLRVGAPTGNNLGIDQNEIQARNGSDAASTLYLNRLGGDVLFGAATFGAWTDVTFQNSWTNWGSPHQAVQYRKIGDIVQIRGLAQKDAAISGAETIFTLPTGFRPPAREVWSCRARSNAGEIQGRIDVYPTGLVQNGFTSTATADNWLSFHHSFSTT